MGVNIIKFKRIIKENNIEILVKVFRKALDDAKADGKLANHPVFSRFPIGCCDLTCDLLAQYLSEKDIETFAVRGTCKFDWQQHHVWLIARNGIVIDITGDQFAGKTGFPQVIQAVHVGREGELQEIFGMERELWPFTNFVDEEAFDGFNGTPNVRQRGLIETNNIIRQYL